MGLKKQRRNRKIANRVANLPIADLIDRLPDKRTISTAPYETSLMAATPDIFNAFSSLDGKLYFV